VDKDREDHIYPFLSYHTGEYIIFVVFL